MLNDLIEQFQSNPVVKYGVLFVFVLLVWMFSGSLFNTLVVIVAMILGRLSYSDPVDKIEI